MPAKYFHWLSFFPSISPTTSEEKLLRSPAADVLIKVVSGLEIFRIYWDRDFPGFIKPRSINDLNFSIWPIWSFTNEIKSSKFSRMVMQVYRLIYVYLHIWNNFYVMRLMKNCLMEWN